ncbi:hypothetical protein RAS1_12440 [Phycisphaerae bacterium RAS1]|nr:hypothetical protein RAS1_12440 [Phycisphaerae bacterium RAS1]
MKAWQRRLLSAGVFGLLLGAGAIAADRPAPLTTAELLVHLARDHALTRGGQQTPADVMQVRALLRAATRVDSRLPDPYVWLYELAMLERDNVQAADALQKLVKLDVTNVGAFGRWLDAGLATRQTLEDRKDWLDGLSEAAARPPQMQALIQLHIARLAVYAMDRAQARMQLDRVLGLDPFNPDAAAVAVEALDATTPPALRLRAGLRLLQLNPMAVDVAWEIGILLDDYGLPDEADKFYTHATEVFRLSDPSALLPGEYLLQQARNAVARQQPDRAIDLAKQVIDRFPNLAAQAGLLLHWLFTQRGRTTEAGVVAEQLGKRFASIREPMDFAVDEVAQAAWFYCMVDPQPQRALSLAESAAARAAGDIFATRVHGWAQEMNGQFDAARATLTPIAELDPYAAYKVARLLKDAGDEPGAIRVVETCERFPLVGPARDLFRETGLPASATQPAGMLTAEMRDVLSGFDREALAFHREPARFLEASIRLEDRSVEPGDPWRAEFILTNRARFPITLGPDGMVNPVFLLSFQVEGDKKRDFPNLLTVTLDRARVVPPGGSVRTRQTIDVGPIRKIMRMTPQHAQRVVLSATLDPMRGPDGQWKPAPGGQTLPALYFNRVPVGTSPQALNALFAALGGDSDVQRFRAVEILAEMLGEAQNAALGRLNYKPRAVAADAIRKALLAGLSSDSWENRVRTLDAMQNVGLDAAMLAAVNGCLDHSHWLVRMMAVRLMVRQGASFAEVLAEMAAGDEDELVRELAGSYIEAQRAAASQPAPRE